MLPTDWLQAPSKGTNLLRVTGGDALAGGHAHGAAALGHHAVLERAQRREAVERGPEGLLQGPEHRRRGPAAPDAGLRPALPEILQRMLHLGCAHFKLHHSTGKRSCERLSTYLPAVFPSKAVLQTISLCFFELL